MTIHQAEPLALSTGMPASEFTKLRARLIVPLSKKIGKSSLNNGLELPTIKTIKSCLFYSS
ncbi:hypothetical protein EKM01_08715 [Flavobacterium sp. RSP46]|uniref:hypothetical protein n=1 Tax=Flavobacterium sp. RSP46 TaxID=2497486 RepID=UPI000F879431|nr:hypothetical protein [Flavobacterium sp. RSP46]RTY91110.1 hypothetical protein EKM01_08715 [Flavobacterium sp. RSP46]